MNKWVSKNCSSCNWSISFEFMLEQFLLDINAAKTTLKYTLEYFFPSSLSRRCENKVWVVNDRCRTTTNWFDWLNRRLTIYHRFRPSRYFVWKIGRRSKKKERKPVSFKNRITGSDGASSRRGRRPWRGGNSKIVHDGCSIGHEN